MFICPLLYAILFALRPAAVVVSKTLGCRRVKLRRFVLSTNFCTATSLAWFLETRASPWFKLTILRLFILKVVQNWHKPARRRDAA